MFDSAWYENMSSRKTEIKQRCWLQYFISLLGSK